MACILRCLHRFIILISHVPTPRAQPRASTSPRTGIALFACRQPSALVVLLSVREKIDTFTI